MRVLVHEGNNPPFGLPGKVVDGPYAWNLEGRSGRSYDVSSKGDRFLVLKPVSQQPALDLADRLVVVQN
jgi:hypothetical protein